MNNIEIINADIDQIKHNLAYYIKELKELDKARKLIYEYFLKEEEKYSTLISMDCIYEGVAIGFCAGRYHAIDTNITNRYFTVYLNAHDKKTYCCNLSDSFLIKDIDTLEKAKKLGLNWITKGEKYDNTKSIAGIDSKNTREGLS